MQEVTLANLSSKTEQEVFDYVADHLLQQNRKSISGVAGCLYTRCLYKGPDNLRCAAGCLIAAEEYKPILEGKSWTRLARAKYVPEEHSLLIRSLQTVHDGWEPKDWRKRLILVGQEYSLNVDRLRTN